MGKDSYEVNLDDIICRRAKETDNMKEIATLIYQTDPYIYPYWFEKDINKAIDFLSDKILMPGFIFNYENIYLAIEKFSNKTIGLVVALDPSVNLDFDYKPYIGINENNKVTIEKYIYGCIEDVKNNDAMYIMNCTVLEECRGRRIGTKLLGHFISNMEKVGFENYRLDCLLHNLRAKNLYHGLGFKEMEEVEGFRGYVKNPVEVVVFKRHKGDYLPGEFQKKEHYTGLVESKDYYSLTSQLIN